MRDLLFEVAHWWRLSPFEIEGLPLSAFLELYEQALRIEPPEDR